MIYEKMDAKTLPDGYIKSLWASYAGDCFTANLTFIARCYIRGLNCIFYSTGVVTKMIGIEKVVIFEQTKFEEISCLKHSCPYLLSFRYTRPQVLETGIFFADLQK